MRFIFLYCIYFSGTLIAVETTHQLILPVTILMTGDFHFQRFRNGKRKYTTVLTSNNILFSRFVRRIEFFDRLSRLSAHRLFTIFLQRDYAFFAPAIIGLFCYLGLISHKFSCQCDHNFVHDYES